MEIVPFQLKLAAARVNAGLTQEQVAKKLRVSKQTICNWESEKTAPSIQQGRQLSELFGIPLDYIFLSEKSN